MRSSGSCPRQKREAKTLAGLKLRQRKLDRAERRFQSWLVTVEAEDRLVGHLPEQAKLVFGQRRAKLSHARFEAGCDAGDHIDIALDDDHLSAPAQHRTRRMTVVENPALVEERRLRRVQIFGLRISRERSAPKSDDAAAQIGNRKHHPVAEAIEGDGDVLARDQQSGLDHLLLRDASSSEMLFQGIPRSWGIPNAEALLDIGCQAAFAQIGARFAGVRRVQRGFEELRRLLHYFVQAGALGLTPLRIRIARRQRDTGLLRQLRHRFGKAEPFLLEQEGEMIS